MGPTLAPWTLTALNKMQLKESCSRLQKPPKTVLTRGVQAAEFPASTFITTGLNAGLELWLMATLATFGAILLTVQLQTQSSSKETESTTAITQRTRS